MTTSRAVDHRSTPLSSGRVASLVVGLALVAACGGPSLPPRTFYDALERQSGRDYLVGPGDVLRVNVFGDERLSTRVTVQPDGRVTLPLVGELSVARRTVAQVNTDVSTAYSRFLREGGQVTVTVEEIHSYSVFVTGRVNRPGEYTPDRPVTVMQALTLAGSPTRFADESRIIILRGTGSNQQRIPFSVPAVIEDGQDWINVTLVSGDTVYVP
ncbi:MAG: polysaccharide biosynthesis/export family protein [Deltaproteobacteria bacterium]|nr:polysaccharide biosynthesis/export family protein [Deltaproteobacteria bacterium]